MIAAGAFATTLGATGSAIVAGAINGAIIGAVVGGVNAAMNGQDILSGIGKGALTGAVTGAVAGGISEAFSASTTTAEVTGEAGAQQLAGTTTQQIAPEQLVSTETGVAAVDPTTGAVTPTQTNAMLDTTATAGKEAVTGEAVKSSFWGDIDAGEVALKAGEAGFGYLAEVKGAEIAAEAKEGKVGVEAIEQKQARVVKDAEEYVTGAATAVAPTAKAPTVTAGVVAPTASVANI
jgi:hypothetical protein